MKSEERIIAAAQELVQRGEGDFTMEELAQASSVSRATLYRRFSSKEAIIERLQESGLSIASRARPARERILEAMLELSNQSGLFNLTIEEIAASAEVSAVTVYRIFEDREGLLRAFVQASLPQQIVQETLGEEVSRDGLERFLVSIFASMLANRGLLLSVMLADEEQRALLDRLREEQRRTRDMLSDYLERMMDDELIRRCDASALSYQILGEALALLLIQPQLERWKMNPEAMIIENLGRLWEGIALREDPREEEKSR